jgi:hypothetical protein
VDEIINITGSVEESKTGKIRDWRPEFAIFEITTLIVDVEQSIYWITVLIFEKVRKQKKIGANMQKMKGNQLKLTTTVYLLYRPTVVRSEKKSLLNSKQYESF